MINVYMIISTRGDPSCNRKPSTIQQGKHAVMMEGHGNLIRLLESADTGGSFPKR